MLDLNEMAVFASVAQHGSFTRAAERLNMPKSTVSRHVSQLEERLGVRLIHRTTRKLKLTEVGKMYVEHCERMMDEAEQASHLIQKMQAEPSGLLRISTPLSFGMEFFKDIIQEFLEQYPQVNIELMLENRAIDLVEEEVDIAIRVQPGGALVDSSVIAREIGSGRMILCATPEYLQEHGNPETLEDLAKHPVIRHPGALTIVEKGTERRELALKSRLLINDMVLIRDMTLRHMGIGLVPGLVVFDEVAEGRLLKLLPDYHFIENRFYLVYPSRRQQASKVMAFIDFILAKMQPVAPWDELVL